MDKWKNRNKWNDWKKGIIGVVVVVCGVNEGVETVLGEVDDELGEVGFERNNTLTRVGTQLG